jgi:hypothetical protein
LNFADSEVAVNIVEPKILVMRNKQIRIKEHLKRYNSWKNI